MKKLNLILTVLIVAIPTLVPAKDLKDDRLFQFRLEDILRIDGNKRGPRDLDAVEGKGNKAGKPLSDMTLAAPDVPKAYWMQGIRKLPVGATNQAVAFAAEKNIDPTKGGITFWVKGENWNLNTPDRETFFTLEGADATLTVEKSGPKRVTVKSTNGKSLEAPLDFNPAQLHQFVLNYNAGEVELFIDGKSKGKASGLAFPKAPTRFILGQLGPGPGSNKSLNVLSIYNRPLQLSEIMRLHYEDAQIQLPKAVTIVKSARRPTIDGIFDKDEPADRQSGE